VAEPNIVKNVEGIALRNVRINGKPVESLALAGKRSTKQHET